MFICIGLVGTWRRPFIGLNVTFTYVILSSPPVPSTWCKCPYVIQWRYCFRGPASEALSAPADAWIEIESSPKLLGERGYMSPCRCRHYYVSQLWSFQPFHASTPHGGNVDSGLGPLWSSRTLTHSSYGSLSNARGTPNHLASTPFGPFHNHRRSFPFLFFSHQYGPTHHGYRPYHHWSYALCCRLNVLVL